MLLGQIIWATEPGEGGRLQLVEPMGLRILQGKLTREGYFLGRKRRKLLLELRRQGVRRLLVPEDFDGWEMAEKMGFTRVDVLPFLRSNGGELLLMAMKKRGYQPQHCRVALRGTRVGRDMVMAAEWLVPWVRDISISAPYCGGELQRNLRNQWGLGVAPDSGTAEGVIRFDPGGAAGKNVVLSLFGNTPELGGLTANHENFPYFLETEPLELLSALWETGRIERGTLEFYLT